MTKDIRGLGEQRQTRASAEIKTGFNTYTMHQTAHGTLQSEGRGLQLEEISKTIIMCSFREKKGQTIRGNDCEGVQTQLEPLNRK